MLCGKIDQGWTPAEDETVRRMYPNYAAMQLVLRHRSYHALRGRCAALRIVAAKHVWTTTENKRLKDIWRSASPLELRAAFPFVTYQAIKGHGKDLALGPRGRPPLALSGNSICDAVRDRCRELGYTMKYLDEIAGTGTYFYKGNWVTRKRHTVQHLMKAVETLGGVVSVTFPD